MREIVVKAIEDLCVAFESHGYNPTPIIDLGVLVANADGKIGAQERKTLRDVFQALLDTKLTHDVVEHLITASLEVMLVAGAEPRARLVAAILVDCEAVESGVVSALAVAFANDGLSKDELMVIERIARNAGLEDEVLKKLVDRVRAGFDGDPQSVRFALTQ